jgi:hypothetical protein
MAAGLRQLTDRERAIIGKYAATHGQVRGLEVPIADDAGNISMPLLRLPLLARLEQRGTITRAEAEAGERFHSLFQHAGLDGLRAADMTRVPTAIGAVPGDISPSNERCRARIAAAVAALGGKGSIAASIAWHVCGLEWSVRRWAIATRRPQDLACGILIAALGVLAAHFASGRHTRPSGA